MKIETMFEIVTLENIDKAMRVVCDKMNKNEINPLDAMEYDKMLHKYDKYSIVRNAHIINHLLKLGY